MAGKENVPMESPETIFEAERHRMLMEEEESKKQVQHQMPKIQRIPFLLRDNKNFKKYYKPRAVSLGPINHDDHKFKQTEKYKLRLAKKFIQESGQESKTLHRKVKEKINELRECFEEEVTRDINNEDLAWMLFVDGCAILQFIHSFSITFPTTDKNHENQFKKLGIQNHSVVFGRQDLFLLENQLPYCLLESLMIWSNRKTELEKSIDGFIDMYINNSESPQDHVVDIEGSKNSHLKPTHLLDLLRKKLLELPQSTSTNKKQSIGTDHRKPKRANGQQLRSFRNVHELKSAGIRVKPSESPSLRDISFGKRINFYPGHLKLPPMIVDDSTEYKFLNLIAYEMCPDFENDYGVTSYIAFLDSLIDQANDVQELRKAGILQNFLGSDEEVAKLFNEIGTDLVPDPNTYSDVKDNIQQFYNNKWMTWLTKRFHEYFSSRTFWAIIGALAGLGLSAAQVRLAAYPPPAPCDNFCKVLNI